MGKKTPEVKRKSERIERKKKEKRGEKMGWKENKEICLMKKKWVEW